MHLVTLKCSKDSALTSRASDEPWGFLSLAGFLEFSLRSVLSESSASYRGSISITHLGTYQPSKFPGPSQTD